MYWGVPKYGTGPEKHDESRVRIRVDRAHLSPNAPLITFACHKMPLLYAVKLTAKLGKLQYTTTGNIVTLCTPEPDPDRHGSKCVQVAIDIDELCTMDGSLCSISVLNNELTEKRKRTIGPCKAHIVCASNLTSAVLFQVIDQAAVSGMWDISLQLEGNAETMRFVQWWTGWLGVGVVGILLLVHHTICLDSLTPDKPAPKTLTYVIVIGIPALTLLWLGVFWAKFLRSREMKT